MVAMQLFKILQNKKIKIVAYLKNYSLSINNIILYKLENYIKPHFSNFKVIKS